MGKIKNILQGFIFCALSIGCAAAAWLAFFRYCMTATQWDILEIYAAYMMFIFMPSLFLPGLAAELIGGIKNACKKHKKRAARSAGRKKPGQHKGA